MALRISTMIPPFVAGGKYRPGIEDLLLAPVTWALGTSPESVADRAVLHDHGALPALRRLALSSEEAFHAAASPCDSPAESRGGRTLRRRKGTEMKLNALFWCDNCHCCKKGLLDQLCLADTSNCCVLLCMKRHPPELNACK